MKRGPNPQLFPRHPGLEPGSRYPVPHKKRDPGSTGMTKTETSALYFAPGPYSQA